MSKFPESQPALPCWRAGKSCAFAVRANADLGSQSRCNRLVIRHVSGGLLGRAASDAVDFTRLAGPLVLCPARLEIGGKVPAKDQYGALVCHRLAAPPSPRRARYSCACQTAGQPLPPYSCDGFSQAGDWGGACAWRCPVLCHSLAGRFQLHHQLPNLRVRLSGDPGSIQRRHLMLRASPRRARPGSPDA